MRLLLIGILMGFPLLEGAVLYKLAYGPSGHGGWVLAWLVFACIAGIVLIKEARFSLMTRLAGAFSQGQFSLAAFIDSFRTVLAGLLLIFPGIISDVMALALLLLPIREPALQQASMRPQRPSHGPRFRPDGVIEGEFRRER
ncbi:MAG: FxsA family protein [Betaproteobacteria bacterium]|nr:FxsA family protein [Betaproteobacteria bacterium]